MRRHVLKSHRKTVFEALGRHPIHPFPARMSPGIALDALSESDEPLRVLDPMSGSGTVLAVAKANGHHAIGIDIDPLAVLLARVWTRPTDPDCVRDKAAEVLGRAKTRFQNLKLARAYPHKSDEETQAFIRYWFDDHARRQLSALASCIRRVENSAVREALWCGFSRLIITKQAGASLAMDLSHSRPHKTFSKAPINPFDRFCTAVDTVVSNCPQIGKSSVGPRVRLTQGDARKLDVRSDSIDLVLTSPPYLNAIDYMRCSKFSLVWMGHTIGELRQIRAGSVGTEAALEEASNAQWVATAIKHLRLKPALSDQHRAILSRYVWDMSRALSEVARVLRRGGRAVYVVGDSTCRGTFIRNSSIVAAMAERHGLQIASRHSRALPANRRYLRRSAKSVRGCLAN